MTGKTKRGVGAFMAERLGRGRRATAAALMAAITVAGIASATIPNGGVINGCYTRSGGSLRVIDASVTKCGKSETSLSWNVEGPAGPQGEQGPIGPTGPAGANGVSSGFWALLENGLEVDTATTQGVVVLSKIAPAGSYVLTARVLIVGRGLGSALCWIPGRDGTRDLAIFGFDSEDNTEHMSLTSGVVHAGGAIELRCSKSTSVQSDFDVFEASLSGVQVNTLN